MRYYQEMQKTAKELDKLHRFLESKGLTEGVEIGLHVRIISYPEKISIEFDDIKHLSNARKIAKEYYPGWTDKVDAVWNTWGTKVMTSWVLKENPLLKLWLHCDIKDYPKSLKKPGCKFEKVTNEIERYEMVCDVK